MIFRTERDEWVYRAVYVENEYQIAADLKGKTVLDIGANCGSFTRLCLDRGARVVAFEPDPGNAAQWRLNCPHKNARLYEMGVWKPGTFLLAGNGDPLGFSLMRGKGTIVPCISFSEAVRMADSEVIDVCKIDAEGVEFDIIEAQEGFGAIQELNVEFHGGYAPMSRIDGCRLILAALGFREERWDVVHPEQGTYRLYRGRRA